MQLSLSAYFPALLLSGVIWPLEAVSHLTVIPTTTAILLNNSMHLSFVIHEEDTSDHRLDTPMDLMAVICIADDVGGARAAVDHDPWVGHHRPAGVAGTGHHRGVEHCSHGCGSSHPQDTYYQVLVQTKIKLKQ